MISCDIRWQVSWIRSRYTVYTAYIIISSVPFCCCCLYCCCRLSIHMSRSFASTVFSSSRCHLIITRLVHMTASLLKCILFQKRTCKRGSCKHIRKLSLSKETELLLGVFNHKKSYEASLSKESIRVNLYQISRKHLKPKHFFPDPQHKMWEYHFLIYNWLKNENSEICLFCQHTLNFVIKKVY